MSNIIHFLPQLQQLRTIYTDFVELDEMDWGAFCKVVDFYYAHRDSGQFEKMMLDLVFEQDKQTTAMILSSINSEIDKILEIYYKNDGVFGDIEPEVVSNDLGMSHHSEIEGLVEKLNICGSEFCRITDIVNLKADYPEGMSDDDLWNEYDAIMAQHQSVTGKSNASCPLLSNLN